MTRWQYFAATLTRGMLSWHEDGSNHSQSLVGGLDFLGSRGWELVGTISKDILGTTENNTLIFKRPSEG
jgi:hypothetical protein